MKFAKPFSAEEIARLLDARVVGNPETKIFGLNEIHMVEEGDISFTDHPKYFKKSLQSKASVVLINDIPEDTYGKTLIVSDQPFDDFNKLIHNQWSLPHVSSKIPESCRIGKNVHIGPNVYLGERTVIGDNCIIHPNVVIYGDVIIGHDVIIHSGCVIGADAFYFKRKPEGYEKFTTCGRVIIGNKVEIGALCTIDRGVTGDTVIGDGSKFDNQVHIGHDSFIGKNVLMAAQCAVAGVVVIEDDVILWGQVGVTKEVRIGKGAQVLAKSGVLQSLEAGKRYLGNPTSEAFTKNREWALLKKLPELFRKNGL
jgi:UDP-3-O-[3-hydroxymyristoyl] glucosamine N-acyltransferase